MYFFKNLARILTNQRKLMTSSVQPCRNEAYRRAWQPGFVPASLSLPQLKRERTAPLARKNPWLSEAFAASFGTGGLLFLDAAGQKGESERERERESCGGRLRFM